MTLFKNFFKNILSSSDRTPPRPDLSPGDLFLSSGSPFLAVSLTDETITAYPCKNEKLPESKYLLKGSDYETDGDLYVYLKEPVSFSASGSFTRIGTLKESDRTEIQRKIASRNNRGVSTNPNFEGDPPVCSGDIIVSGSDQYVILETDGKTVTAALLHRSSRRPGCFSFTFHDRRYEIENELVSFPMPEGFPVRGSVSPAVLKNYRTFLENGAKPMQIEFRLEPGTILESPNGSSQFIYLCSYKDNDYGVYLPAFRKGTTRLQKIFNSAEMETAGSLEKEEFSQVLRQISIHKTRMSEAICSALAD